MPPVRFFSNRLIADDMKRDGPSDSAASSRMEGNSLRVVVDALPGRRRIMAVGTLYCMVKRKMAGSVASCPWCAQIIAPLLFTILSQPRCRPPPSHPATTPPAKKPALNEQQQRPLPWRPDRPATPSSARDSSSTTHPRGAHPPPPPRIARRRRRRRRSCRPRTIATPRRTGRPFTGG